MTLFYFYNTSGRAALRGHQATRRRILCFTEWVSPMSNALEEYEQIKAGLLAVGGVTAGHMFGKACLKINGKAFLSQHKETIVFKLAGTEHGKAICQPEAILWDPSGKGRPMKEWVALTVASQGHFHALAAAAMAYVRRLA